jgi:RNA polymerase sigma-70 factor, ECF subfamily
VASEPSLTAARAVIAAHPAIQCDPEQLADHLDALAADPGEPDLVADLHVAFAAAHGDPAAIAAFEAAAMPAATAALRALGASPEDVTECLQRTRERLLVAPADGRPRLLAFRGGARLRSWVRVVAIREALMLYRARPRDVALGDALLAAVPDPADDPRLVYLRDQARDALGTVMADAIAALAPRDRLLLRYTLLDDLSLEQVGTLYGVHKSTISRWLSAARDQLWQRARTLLVERFGETVSASSLVRALRSGLDLSLERLL